MHLPEGLRQTLSQAVPTSCNTALRDGHQRPHFTDDETEAQRHHLKLAQPRHSWSKPGLPNSPNVLSLQHLSPHLSTKRRLPLPLFHHVPDSQGKAVHPQRAESSPIPNEAMQRKLDRHPDFQTPEGTVGPGSSHKAASPGSSPEGSGLQSRRALGMKRRFTGHPAVWPCVFVSQSFSLLGAHEPRLQGKKTLCPAAGSLTPTSSPWLLVYFVNREGPRVEGHGSHCPSLLSLILLKLVQTSPEQWLYPIIIITTITTITIIITVTNVTLITFTTIMTIILITTITSPLHHHITINTTITTITSPSPPPSHHHHHHHITITTTITTTSPSPPPSHHHFTIASPSSPPPHHHHHHHHITIITTASPHHHHHHHITITTTTSPPHHHHHHHHHHRDRTANDDGVTRIAVSPIMRAKGTG